MSLLYENIILLILEYINLVFALTVIKVCYKITDFSYSFITMLILVGIAISFILHGILRKSRHKIIFFIIVLISIIAISFYKSNYIIEIINQYVINNVIFVNDLIAKGVETPFTAYKPILLLVLPLFTFGITSISYKGLYNSILIIVFTIITILWYLGYTEEINKFLFYYILITLTTYCLNSYKRNFKKLSQRGLNVNIDSKKFLIYTVAAGVIIAGITDIMPQEFKGKYSSDIKGKFINKYVQDSQSEETKGKVYKYDLSFSGYDRNSKKLGGPITINKLVAFKVKSDKPYYLKGTVKDYYDGFRWTQSEQKYTVQPDKDTSMLKDNFSKPFFNNSNSLTIYPDEINSTSLFEPNFAYNVHLNSGNIFYDETPTFITGNVIHKEYNIDFYNLNAEGEAININGIGTGKSEVGALYYSDNYKKFLQVPNNISPRIYDLVYSLTKDKKYNYEKVNAIKEYLNKSFPYTLKVSNVPENQEFLDYFLFTEKKGYCTYFATAETIMCRIAGIPARYVEGFNMTSEKDSKGLFIVKNENAHAWTEILYMQNPFVGLWYTVDAVPNAVELIHKEEDTNKLATENPSKENGTPITGPNKNKLENSTDNGYTSTKSSLPPIVIKLIFMGLLIFTINVLLLLINLWKKNRLLKNKSIIPIYNFSLERLASTGIQKGSDISDLEFADSLDETIREEVSQAAMFAYYEYFGGRKPAEFNKLKYYNFIEDYVKRRQKKLTYFFKKFYFFKEISFLKRQIVIIYNKIVNID